MLVFSHKMVFIANEASCLIVRNHARTCKDICSCNLVCNFLIQLLPLKRLVFVVRFLNAFWHGNETFPKDSSQYEFVPVLVVFHVSYSKYKGVKICFYPCVIKIKIFHSRCTRVVCVALVSHSCRLCLTRAALVFVQHLCRTRVACVSLVLHSCCIRVASVTTLSLVFGTRVVNQTRSHVIVMFEEKNY